MPEKLKDTKEFFYDPNDGSWNILSHRMPSVRDKGFYYRLLIRPEGYEGSGVLQKIVSEGYIRKTREVMKHG